MSDPLRRHRAVCANDDEPWPCSTIASLDAALASPVDPLREAALAVMDVADLWVDDKDNALWDDIPVELADRLDALRAALASPAAPRPEGLDARLVRDTLDHIEGLNLVMAALRVGGRTPEKGLRLLDRTNDVPTRLARLSDTGDTES